MTSLEEFKNNRYVGLKNIVPQNICRIITNYALLKEKISFFPEEGPDAQVIGAHSEYADALMETMLFFLQPHMEAATGLELAPTYSYYRVYRPGMDLKRHKDRPSCEISTTVCFGINYKHQDPDYNWGMYVDKDSVGVWGENGYFKSAGNSGLMMRQNPGDIIIYRGYDIEHWRDIFEGEYGSYQVQAFFHYIDKNGPYYPEFEYDKRPGLGFKPSSLI